MRLLTIGIMLLMTATVFGQQSSAAKAVAAKNGDAVVTVKISVKMRVSGDGQTSNEEQKNEIIGTVISPDGIILVPLSATDPTDIISRAMGDNEESNFKMNVDVVELKVRTPEGLEIPGKVILRDQDMDLAFIKLNKKPANPMVYVDINKNSTVGLLDDVIVMGRTSPSIYRSLCVDCEKVEVMVKKPQPFYILTHSGSASNLGSPIFDFSGKFVGIMVLRATTQLRGSKGNSGPHAIVRPAAVIAKSAGTLLKNNKTIVNTTTNTGKNTGKSLKNDERITVFKGKITKAKSMVSPVVKKKISAAPVKKNVVKPTVKKTVPASTKKKAETKKTTAKKVEKTKKMEIVPVKKTN